MSATLGGLIKDLRLQKNIPQTDLAFALGWKEASRISRIEQGRVEKPKRETLDKIIKAMNLTEEERNTLYRVGNYLPSDKDIENIRKKVKKTVDAWPYPASCVEYTWRIIYTNNKMFDIFGIPRHIQDLIHKQKPSILEIVFDQNSPLRNPQNKKEEEDYRKDFKRMLLQFHHIHKKSTKEKWYQNLIKRMMSNELFGELWPMIQQQTTYDFDLVNTGSKKYTIELGSQKYTLNYYYFASQVFGDPRYEIEFYVPADSTTFKYYNK